MGIRAGNYLPLLMFSTKEVLILSVSKQLHTDNIYERHDKNGKDACTYMHFKQ